MQGERGQERGIGVLTGASKGRAPCFYRPVWVRAKGMGETEAGVKERAHNGNGRLGTGC